MIKCAVYLQFSSHCRACQQRLWGQRGIYEEIPASGLETDENEHADRLAKTASVEHMTFNIKVLSFVQYLLAINEIDIQVISMEAD